MNNFQNLSSSRQRSSPFCNIVVRQLISTVEKRCPAGINGLPYHSMWQNMELVFFITNTLIIGSHSWQRKLSAHFLYILECWNHEAVSANEITNLFSSNLGLLRYHEITHKHLTLNISVQFSPQNCDEPQSANPRVY